MRKVSGFARLLLILIMEVVCLSPESCLRSHSVLPQEKRSTQAEKSSEAAQEAVTYATGAALQAKTTSAVKILLGVPVPAFAGEDAEWRSCMIDRFGPSARDLPFL
jgi:hypothetical protein